MNVIGEPVDELGEVTSKRSLFDSPSCSGFDEQSTTLEMFETGIKVIDFRSAVFSRRKDWFLRRCGRWQNGFDSGAHQQRRQGAQTDIRYSPASANALVKATTYCAKFVESGVITLWRRFMHNMEETGEFDLTRS